LEGGVSFGFIDLVFCSREWLLRAKPIHATALGCNVDVALRDDRLIPFLGTATFLAACDFLFFQSPAARSRRGASGLARDHWLEGFEDELPQHVSACLHVARLLAMDLTADHKCAVVGNAVRSDGAQSPERAWVKNRGCIQIPTQSGFRVDFIDVLTSWATASRKDCLQFASWDRQIRADDEIFHKG